MEHATVTRLDRGIVRVDTTLGHATLDLGAAGGVRVECEGRTVLSRDPGEAVAAAVHLIAAVAGGLA